MTRRLGESEQLLYWRMQPYQHLLANHVHHVRKMEALRTPPPNPPNPADLFNTPSYLNSLSFSTPLSERAYADLTPLRSDASPGLESSPYVSDDFGEGDNSIMAALDVLDPHHPLNLSMPNMQCLEEEAGMEQDNISVSRIGLNLTCRRPPAPTIFVHKVLLSPNNMATRSSRPPMRTMSTHHPSRDDQVPHNAADTDDDTEIDELAFLQPPTPVHPTSRLTSVPISPRHRCGIRLALRRTRRNSACQTHLAGAGLRRQRDVEAAAVASAGPSFATATTLPTTASPQHPPLPPPTPPPLAPARPPKLAPGKAEAAATRPVCFNGPLLPPPAKKAADSANIFQMGSLQLPPPEADCFSPQSHGGSIDIFLEVAGFEEHTLPPPPLKSVLPPPPVPLSILPPPPPPPSSTLPPASIRGTNTGEGKGAVGEDSADEDAEDGVAAAFLSDGSDPPCGRPSAATKEALENCYKQVPDVLDATYKQTGYSSKCLMDGFLLHIHSDKTRGSNEWNRYQQYANRNAATASQSTGMSTSPTHGREATTTCLWHCWWMSSIGHSQMDGLFTDRKLQSLLIHVGSHVNEDTELGTILSTRGLFNLPSSLKFDKEDLLGVTKTIAFTTTADQLEGVDLKICSTAASSGASIAASLASVPTSLAPKMESKIKPDLDKRACAAKHGVANTKSVHQIRELMAAAAVKDIVVDFFRKLPLPTDSRGPASIKSYLETEYRSWATPAVSVCRRNFRPIRAPAGSRSAYEGCASSDTHTQQNSPGGGLDASAVVTYWRLSGDAQVPCMIGEQQIIHVCFDLDALKGPLLASSLREEKAVPKRAAVASKRTAKSAKGKGKGKMEEVESEDEEEAEEEGAVQEGSRAAPQKDKARPRSRKHPKSPICEASNGEASPSPRVWKRLQLRIPDSNADESDSDAPIVKGKKRQSPADHHKKPAKRVRLAPPEASRDAPVKSVEPNPVEFDWELSACAPPTVIPCPRNANPPDRGSATVAGAPCARMQSHVEVPPAAVDPRRLGMLGAAIQPAKDQCKRCLQAPSNAVAGPSGQKHQPSRAPSTERQRQRSPVPSPPSTVAPPAPPPAGAADPMAVLQALANFLPEQIMATFAMLRDATAPAGN
ncbi:hypothetical protein B0H17DRAFT_1137443 [Mycena rosella]|uniref:Uncharacterized protein n=1 Tax=Mycena rosella TaxID=1033263 RepID=A0AAD7D8R4_MYCRO|nr:hypothetical protein B0H17DRAFT_1137443 [Mycena rosella]